MEFEIIHTNDIHSHIENLAKLGAYVQKCRANHSNLLLVDAGDFITGEFQFKYLKGKTEEAIINYLQYDVMTLGNHDFDYDMDFLKQHMQAIDTNYVLSNLLDNEQLIGDYKQTYIKEIDGLKIGFLSIVLPYLENIVEHRGIKGFEFINSEHYHKIVKQLKADGADLIIALNHQGIDNDRQLAKMNLGIDLIISSHSHTRLEEALVVNGTPIVQTGSFAQNLGRIKFTVEGKKIVNFKYQLVNLNALELSDLAIEAMIKQNEANLQQYIKETYAISGVKLEGERELMITRSTNLGSLVCDSYMYHAKEAGYKPDFALVNSRGLRQSINPGPITNRELYNVMPFEKKIIICELKGKDLVEALTSPVEFQTANLMIEMNDEVRKFKDFRTKELIKKNKVYQLVTIDYLYNHELFSGLRSGQLLTADLGNDVQVVAKYLRTLEPNFTYESNQMVKTISHID